MKDRFFSDTAFILAFLTSVSYVLGVTYCQGFLREFGLDDTQFFLPFDRYLFQGYVSFSDIGFPAATMLITIALCIVVLVMVYLVAREKLKSKLTLQKKNKEEAKDTLLDNDPLFKLSTRILFVGSSIFVGFLAILLVAIFSTNAGSKAAINFKKQIEEGKIKEVYVAMKAPEDSFRGASIVCSQNQCAYWINDTSRIVNLSDVRLIELVAK